MGDEITIDLPKNWYEDNNFLGFALFWHHVPFDDDDDDDLFRHLFPIDDDDDDDDGFEDGTLRLLISNGDQFGRVESKYVSIHIENSTLFADLALMVVYFPQIAISSEYRSNRWNKFKTRFSALPNEAFKVKSCGIHLIYDHGQDHPQQSLQLFNVKRSHDDTEDHPHHKRSKHV